MRQKSSGGSRLDPEVTWVALLGTAVAVTPIEIDNQESFKQVSFLAPPLDELVNVCVSTTACAVFAPSANDVEVKVSGMVVSPRY
jgi:hypothetical protein